MCFKYDLILFRSPRTTIDLWIQMVVPPVDIVVREYLACATWRETEPFSTLFSNSSSEMGSNERPLLGSIFLHQLDDQFIFFSSPWSFYKFRIQNFLPPVK